jgi:hypothetical protein
MRSLDATLIVGDAGLVQVIGLALGKKPQQVYARVGRTF